MRRALTSFISSLAIGVIILAVPTGALAASVPFYYGPLLPCTGFFKIDTTIQKSGGTSATGVTTKELKFQAVSADATPNNPNSSDAGAGATLPFCQSMCDVFVLVNNLMKFLISVLLTIFAPVMLLIGGFIYMTSGGNPGRRKMANNTIVGALVGIAIVLTAALIVSQMMTFIFESQWGEVLKQKAQAQAVAAGLDPTKIPDFSWNTISCEATPGGVNVQTGSSTTTDPYYVPPVKKTCAENGGTCINNSVAGNHRCGGTITTDSCTSLQFPNCCKPTAGDACFATCSRTPGTVWRGIKADNGRTCICEQTVGAVPPVTGGRPATPNECYSDADKAALTCAAGWVAPGTTGMCTSRAKPNLCGQNVDAYPNICYSSLAIQAGAYKCSRPWNTTACPTSSDGTTRWACR